LSTALIPVMFDFPCVPALLQAAMTASSTPCPSRARCCGGTAPLPTSRQQLR
jgi:hypothetical protein